MSIRHEYIIDYLQQKDLVKEEDRKQWGDEALAYFALVDIKSRVESELELDTELRVSENLQAVLNNTAILSMYLSDESDEGLMAAFINANRVPPKRGYDQWAVESYQKYVKLLTAQKEREANGGQISYEWDSEHEMDLWNTIVDLSNDGHIPSATAQQFILLFGLAEDRKRQLPDRVVETALQQASEKIRTTHSFVFGTRLSRDGGKIRSSSVEENRIRSALPLLVKESLDTLKTFVGDSAKDVSSVDELAKELAAKDGTIDVSEARNRIQSLIANGITYLYGNE